MPTPLTLPPPSVVALALLCVGCPRSDVGAPCNHGQLDPPRTPTVSFPALACDQLMCVYANADEPPAAPCESDTDCNAAGAPERFECIAGACQVSATHVLSRSMCSQRCESDADCEDGDRSTACETGFRCARIQSLGDFCCEKLCVCRDDLDEAAATMREEGCAAGTLRGCCDQDPVPEACGG
jgi:hypothetical protein